ncbi:uncharacterized protein LOC135805592 [Sycon ciliatum]|uniref:uncharacterized protein LOC135805592 n=1 Tax=Sycon ciliatum TaxID=27933 RepID=UPI0031F70385
MECNRAEDEAVAATTAKKLPIIDLRCDDKTTATALRQACVEFGFFYIVNHGITDEQFAELFEQAKLFFALPLEEKERCNIDRSTNRGYIEYGSERNNPVKQTTGGTKEGYHMGNEMTAERAKASGEVHRANKWPQEAVVPHFKTTMIDYYNTICAVGMKLLRIVALALDMEADYFHQFFTKHIALLRVLHYDETLSKPDEGLFGAGEHTDFGMLTLLKTDDVPGLQIQWPDGEWVDVAPIEGAIVVNIADMLERWTNGMFKSTLHRVLNTTGRERYSAPFFFDCNADATIECLPTCCSSESPAKYEPILSGEYLLKKLKEIYPEG